MSLSFFLISIMLPPTLAVSFADPLHLINVVDKLFQNFVAILLEDDRIHHLC